MGETATLSLEALEIRYRSRRFSASGSGALDDSAIFNTFWISSSIVILLLTTRQISTVDTIMIVTYCRIISIR